MNTTTHPVAPEQVMAFLDGELAATEAETISKHVNHCPECTTLADHFRAVSKVLSTWDIGPLPPGLDTPVSTGRRKAFPAWRRRVGWSIALCAVSLLLFTLTVPNLLRSRMAANEASAVGSLRTLNTSLSSYVAAYRRYPLTLRNLGPSPTGSASSDAADLVDSILSSGQKSGYVFRYSPSPPSGYSIVANPSEPGTSGVRRFSTDQTGVIRLGDSSVLDGSEPETQAPSSGGVSQDSGGPLPDAAPMIIRTAQLQLTVEHLADARARMERILTLHHGYTGMLKANSEGGAAPTLSATLRVPQDQLDACIAEFRSLGRVTQESQAGEEVSAQHADLVARLRNSQNTEARLNEILKSGGKQTKDILEVEREAARVRGDIERMEAEQTAIEHRVQFATVELQLTEEYKAQLNSPAASDSTRLHNSFVIGWRNAWETVMGIAMFLAEDGPMILIWLSLLAVPTILVRRRYRRALASL